MSSLFCLFTVAFFLIKDSRRRRSPFKRKIDFKENFRCQGNRDLFADGEWFDVAIGFFIIHRNDSVNNWKIMNLILASNCRRYIMRTRLRAHRPVQQGQFANLICSTSSFSSLHIFLVARHRSLPQAQLLVRLSSRFRCCRFHIRLVCATEKKEEKYFFIFKC